MQIDKLRTSPYYPASNGMLERFHRSLNSLLAKAVKQNQKDWPDHLQTVVAAYRATVNEATRMSPNRIFLRHEVRLPIDLALGARPDECDVQPPVTDPVYDLRERMHQDGLLVRERLGRAAIRMKTRYDAKIKPSFCFEVGEKVWYFYPRRYSKLSPKWQNLYTGPYTVVKLLDPCNVVIRRNAGTRAIVVHRDKLRPAASLNRQVVNISNERVADRPAVPLNQQVVDVNERVGESGEIVAEQSAVLNNLRAKRVPMDRVDAHERELGSSDCVDEPAVAEDDSVWINDEAM